MDTLTSSSWACSLSPGSNFDLFDELRQPRVDPPSPRDKQYDPHCGRGRVLSTGWFVPQIGRNKSYEVPIPRSVRLLNALFDTP